MIIKGYGKVHCVVFVCLEINSALLGVFLKEYLAPNLVFPPCGNPRIETGQL